MFVQQESVPEELLKKKRTARKTGGFLGLGFLCGSFEPICSSLFCQDDEDLIGKVVGSNDPQTPDTSVEYDLVTQDSKYKLGPGYSGSPEIFPHAV